MANGTIFGGMLGKTEKTLTSGKKKRERDIEDEAVKLAPDTSDQSPFDGSNLMQSDGSFGAGSHVSPEGRGRNGY